MLFKKPHLPILKKALFYKSLLLLWPLYQLGQFPNIRLYLLDVILLFTPFVSFKQLKFNHPLLKHLWFFILSLRFTGLVSGLYFLRLSLYSLILTLPLPKNSSKFLGASFYLIPLLGLLQYIFLPDLRFLKAIGYDDHYFRLTFPFLDPNFTGAVLSFIALYAIKDIKNTWPRSLFALSLIALALTFSRVSWLGFAVGLFYLSIKINRLRPFVFASIIVLSLFIFISPKPFGEGVNLTRIFSINARLENLKTGLNLAKINPFLGSGINSGLFVGRSLVGQDNIFIFILVAGGALALSLFLSLVYRTWVFTTDPFLKAGLLSLLIHSLANNTLFYAPVTILVFLLLNLNARKSL